MVNVWVVNVLQLALATGGNLSKEGLEDEEERVRERPMRGNLFKTMSQFSYV